MVEVTKMEQEDIRELRSDAKRLEESNGNANPILLNRVVARTARLVAAQAETGAITHDELEIMIRNHAIQCTHERAIALTKTVQAKGWAATLAWSLPFAGAIASIGLALILKT